MIPNVELLKGRSKGNQKLTLRTEVVGRIQHLFANVDTIDEASLSDEARTVVHVDGLQIEFSPGAFEVEFVTRSG